MMRKLVTWLLLTGLVLGCSVAVYAAPANPPSNAELLAMIQALERRILALEMLHQQTAGQQSSTSQDAPPAGEWRELARGWEYRNPTVRSGSLGYYTFLVEIRRSGPPVQVAGFTVTIFNSERKITGTGSAFLMDLNTGDYKTAEFLVQGDAADAETFRLQVDSAI